MTPPPGPKLQASSPGADVHTMRRKVTFVLAGAVLLGGVAFVLSPELITDHIVACGEGFGDVGEDEFGCQGNRSTILGIRLSDKEVVVWGTVLGAVIGAVLGFAVGIVTRRSWKFVLIGGGIAAVLGVLYGIALPVDVTCPPGQGGACTRSVALIGVSMPLAVVVVVSGLLGALIGAVLGLLMGHLTRPTLAQATGNQ